MEGLVIAMDHHCGNNLRSSSPLQRLSFLLQIPIQGNRHHHTYQNVVHHCGTSTTNTLLRSKRPDPVIRGKRPDREREWGAAVDWWLSKIRRWLVKTPQD
ncbi:hypothetical protein L1987_61228 [Smallanthus sonchifolius]|uniref:Uncharacterized protein n=1 Tax=Smallanthus sonchifolius TaxID=185202 RepID=A0ACB9DAM6_9ASTR|nr:hypothetical protein L1987_61228 [Smallanthus sonchifolius]